MKSFQIFREILVIFMVHVIGDETKFATAKLRGGKCGIPENCCTGRDSSCFVNNGETPGNDNELISFDNSISEPCYCDEGCLETGDCCPDYEAVCTFEGKNCHQFINFQNIQKFHKIIFGQ